MLTSDPLLVNATLNLLPPLIRTRQSIANKIITAVLDFFPAHHVRPPFTPTIRVSVKSMERTARALLWNILKKYVILFLSKQWIKLTSLDTKITLLRPECTRISNV